MTVVVAGVAIVAGMAVALIIAKQGRRRRRLAQRYITIDTRRADQISRLVAAQRGPAETAAEGFRQDLT